MVTHCSLLSSCSLFLTCKTNKNTNILLSHLKMLTEWRTGEIWNCAVFAPLPDPTSDPGGLGGQVWEFPLCTQGVLPRTAAWSFSLPRAELRIFLPLPDGKVVQPTGQSTGLELGQHGAVPGAEVEGAAGR